MEKMKQYLMKRKIDIEWALKTFTDTNLKAFAKGELIMIESIENYIKKEEMKRR